MIFSNYHFKTLKLAIWKKIMIPNLSSFFHTSVTYYKWRPHKGKSSRLKSSFRHYGSITVGFWSKKDSAKNVHTLAYICTKDFITTKFKIGYFFFTNHYTIAAAKVSTESRLKNVAVTSFWLFEAMFLHKLHFFFNSSQCVKKHQD